MLLLHIMFSSTAFTLASVVVVKTAYTLTIFLPCFLIMIAFSVSAARYSLAQRCLSTHVVASATTSAAAAPPRKLARAGPSGPWQS
jgi:hypothetical protein